MRSGEPMRFATFSRGFLWVYVCSACVLFGCVFCVCCSECTSIKKRQTSEKEIEFAVGTIRICFKKSTPSLFTRGSFSIHKTPYHVRYTLRHPLFTQSENILSSVRNSKAAVRLFFSFNTCTLSSVKSVCFGISTCICDLIPMMLANCLLCIVPAGSSAGALLHADIPAKTKTNQTRRTVRSSAAHFA